MKTLLLLCSAIALSLSIAVPASADATIDLSVTRQNAKSHGAEPVRLLVHGGKALLTSQTQPAGKDLRFDQAQNAFQLIDHRHRSVMLMDEPSVIQFTDQTEAMLSMARGFSEQLALLPPKQRAKLEKMIGGDNPLARLAQRGGNTPGKQTFRLAGGQSSVGGVACQRAEVLGSGGKLAEFCLAKADAMPLAQQDYATLEAMRQMALRLAQRAAPLAQRFGFPVPPLDDARLSGLPVEIKTLSGDHRQAVALTRMSSAPVAPQSVEIPAGYEFRPLTAWKF